MLHWGLALLSSSTAVIIIFYIAEILAGKFKRLSANDLILDLTTFALPEVIIRPIVVFVVAAVTSAFFPRDAGVLAETPIWAQFIAFLIFEDMVNYWYHRGAHTFLRKWMWPSHLAHHSSSYMSASIKSRNSVLYYLFFPNLYFAAFLVYLGFGEGFIFYAVVKNVVVTAAHSDLRWDSFLFRHKFLSPLAWLLEHTISIPTTHFAHHAAREDDGIGHYNGNYGSLLFFWDILFGTALISRKYPPKFGVPADPVKGPEPWTAQLLYPLFSRSPGAAQPATPGNSG